jgi:DNA polymerase-3 subunit gamma/tau
VASRYKIYIVDEAHMVTTAGFNALLKLVEEPPPHVKFIFATTEPDKVIGTIRSRTHHYPFRLVPPRVLTDYLGKLCAAEGIAVEAAVLPLVVRAGAGSVRDSLSVLDQLLGGADEHGVAYQQATALLGYTPDSLLDEFVDAFAAGDAGGVFTCVDKVIEVGQDPRRFAEDLLRRIRDLVVVAAVPDALSSGLVEAAGDQAERLSSQAASLGAGELTRAAEVIAAGLTDMRGTTAPRLHLELMCARVLLPGADVDDRGIHARLDRLERRIGMTGTQAALAPVRPEPTRPEPAPRSTAAEPAPVRPEPAADEPAPERAAEPAPRRPEPAEEPSPPDARGPAGGETDDTKLGSERDPTKPAPGAKFTVTDIRRLWPEVLEEVKGKRRFTWILLSQNAHVAELRGDTLLLAMTNAGARDSFGRGGSEDILREALVVVLGADLKVEAMVEPGNASAASPRTPPPAPVAPEPAPSAEPVDPRAREQARQSIRPTREERGPTGNGPDTRDEAVSRDDDDLDDGTESHRDLLTRHLGAEIIADEDAPA